MALSGVTPLKSRVDVADPVECTRTLLVRVLMGNSDVSHIITVAAPDTESCGAAADGRKRGRVTAQGVTSRSSQFRSRARINLAGMFARGGWSRRSAVTS